MRLQENRDKPLNPSAALSVNTSLSSNEAGHNTFSQNKLIIRNATKLWSSIFHVVSKTPLKHEQDKLTCNNNIKFINFKLNIFTQWQVKQVAHSNYEHIGKLSNFSSKSCCRWNCTYNFAVPPYPQLSFWNEQQILKDQIIGYDYQLLVSDTA